MHVREGRPRSQRFMVGSRDSFGEMGSGTQVAGIGLYGGIGGGRPSVNPHAYPGGAPLPQSQGVTGCSSYTSVNAEPGPSRSHDGGPDLCGTLEPFNQLRGLPNVSAPQQPPASLGHVNSGMQQAPFRPVNNDHLTTIYLLKLLIVAATRLRQVDRRNTIERITAEIKRSCRGRVIYFDQITAVLTRLYLGWLREEAVGQPGGVDSRGIHWLVVAGVLAEDARWLGMGEWVYGADLVVGVRARMDTVIGEMLAEQGEGATPERGYEWGQPIAGPSGAAL